MVAAPTRSAWGRVMPLLADRLSRQCLFGGSLCLQGSALARGAVQTQRSDTGLEQLHFRVLASLNSPLGGEGTPPAAAGPGGGTASSLQHA